MRDLYKTLAQGDEVFFRDPDQDISTGHYKVDEILVEPGEEIDDDTIVILVRDDGTSMEAFACECQ